MRRHWLAIVVTLCLAIVMATGCADEASTVSDADLKPTPFDVAATKAELVSQATTQAATRVESEVDRPEPGEEPVAQYDPPFPDRTELFEPRKQAARAARLSTGDSADSVVLMGFAKLDEPRVLLAINGEVKPLRSGEEASGVQVISIDPPRAVLQRGRSRWTASIE